MLILFILYFPKDDSQEIEVSEICCVFSTFTAEVLKIVILWLCFFPLSFKKEVHFFNYFLKNSLIIKNIYAHVTIMRMVLIILLIVVKSVLISECKKES